MHTANCRALFTAILIATSIALAAERSPGADPKLEKTDLFTAGEGGYALYRIPGVVVTAKGTLLAYAEARKSASGDWGHIDIVLRRSTDGGKTWGPIYTFARPQGEFERNPAAVKQGLGKRGELTLNNPVAIVDRTPGVVHFMYCLEYGRCFYLKSEDDGLTFSPPREITSAFERLKETYPWIVLATGPAHGIQLTSGRLIVPVWLSRGTGGHAHRPSVVSTLYSDDHGASWQLGDIVANETDPLINPNETIIAELADGRVVLNMRSESKAHRRAIATSPDGATGWSQPAFQDELVEPICMASMIRLSTTRTSDKNRLLFANPDNLARRDGKEVEGKSRDRKNLTVRLSYDEGAKWSLAKVLEAGPSAYSDLAVGPDGTIYCFYERSSTDGNDYRTKFLTVARFNLEWLTDGKDALAPAAKGDGAKNAQ